MAGSVSIWVNISNCSAKALMNVVLADKASTVRPLGGIWTIGLGPGKGYNGETHQGMTWRWVGGDSLEITEASVPIFTTSCPTHSLFACINFAVHFFLISLLCPFCLPFLLRCAVLCSDVDMRLIMARGLDKLPPSPVLIEPPVSLCVHPLILWRRPPKNQQILNVFFHTKNLDFRCVLVLKPI